MSAGSFTLPEVFEAGVAAAMQGVYVALPGRVESYDAKRGRATVRPLIKRAESVDGEVVSRSHAAIDSVPVMFLGSGAFSVSWTVKPGDIVLLVFMSASMDSWPWGSGGEVDPKDDRRQHLSDAIAIPGLRPFSRALPAISGDALEVEAPAIRLGHGASDPVARKSDLVELASIIGGVFGADQLAALKTALDLAGWPHCNTKVTAS